MKAANSAAVRFCSAHPRRSMADMAIHVRRLGLRRWNSTGRKEAQAPSPRPSVDIEVGGHVYLEPSARGAEPFHPPLTMRPDERL